MPRLPNGNWQPYTPGNPVVTNTTIASTWWNNTYADVGATFEDSLSRSGNGSMLVALGLVDGTAGAPGLSFQSEPGTGLYRPTTGEMDVTMQGTRVMRWTSASFLQTTKDNGATWLNPAYNTEAATFAGVTTTGVSAGLGLTVGSTAANIDVEKVNGYIDLSGATNPASTTGFTNRLTPANVPKVWGLLRFNGSGGVTVLGGFNIASVTVGALSFDVNFATALSSNLYSAPANAQSGQCLALVETVKTTNLLRVQVMTLAAPGTPLNPGTTAFDFDFAVFGLQ